MSVDVTHFSILACDNTEKYSMDMSFKSLYFPVGTGGTINF